LQPAIYVENSTGNVGIGTTAPSEKLELYQGNFLFNNDDTARRDAYIKFVSPTIANGGGWGLVRFFRGSNVIFDFGLAVYNSNDTYIAAKEGISY
jgi:hypothetical protein